MRLGFLRVEEQGIGIERGGLDEAAPNLQAVGVTKKNSAGSDGAWYCSDRNPTEQCQDGPGLLVNTTKDWKRRKILRCSADYVVRRHLAF